MAKQKIEHCHLCGEPIAHIAENRVTAYGAWATQTLAYDAGCDPNLIDPHVKLCLGSYPWGWEETRRPILVAVND